MTSTNRSGGPRLRTALEALDVVDLIAGSNLRQAGSVVVMLATALVGCAVLAVAIGLAGLVIVVLGLSQGPFAWLGTAILWAGLVVGFGGATIVMFRIIRRRPVLTTLAGFDEPDVPLAAGPPAGPSPIVAPREGMTAERLRDLDARLSSSPGTEPARDASVDGPEAGR